MATVIFGDKLRDAIANELGNGAVGQPYVVKLLDSEGTVIPPSSDANVVDTTENDGCVMFFVQEATITGQFELLPVSAGGAAIIFAVPAGTVVSTFEIYQNVTNSAGLKYITYDFDTNYLYNTQGEFTIADILANVGG